MVKKVLGMCKDLIRKVLKMPPLQYGNMAKRLDCISVIECLGLHDQTDGLEPAYIHGKSVDRFKRCLEHITC